VGFQHLSSEERSKIASKAARTLWNVSKEEKEKLLRNSFHSKEARRKSEKVRSGALREYWVNLSYKRWKARVDAAAEGLRRVSKQHSESMSEYWSSKSPGERYQHYLNSFGSKEANKTRRKVQWELLSEEEKREWVRVHLRGMSHRKTEPESILEAYLNSKYPGGYKYVGASKDVSIGGKFPDFINVNGKKEVIEVFGTYWHDEGEVEKKKAHYKTFGFDCKVIWEFECYDSEEIERILNKEV